MIFDFKCSNAECQFIDEYIIGVSTPKTLEPPKECPKCKQGIMEKQFSSTSRVGFDLVGAGFYVNDYGKHNWKKGKSAQEISTYLTPDRETGRYKDPY